MNIEHPSISRRLLPLLDIVFILLAFFIILPQGVHQKKRTNMKRDFKSKMKDLNASRFIYIELLQEGEENLIEVSYMVIKNHRFSREKRRYYDGEIKNQQIPLDLKQLIEKIRGQTRRYFAKKDIQLIVNQRQGLKTAIETPGILATFADKNHIPYAFGVK